MTKKIMRLLLLTACFIMLFSHSAVAGVRSSKHDFSISGASPFKGNALVGGVAISEVCVFCHTPHGASTAAAYGSTGSLLWNRIVPASDAGGPAAYRLYSSSSSTFAIISAPKGLSLMCLSCHDGVTSIAVGALLNAPGSGNPDITWSQGVAPNYENSRIGDIYFDDGNPTDLGWGPNIGNLTYGYTDPRNPGSLVDLSNDHPVSFDWVNVTAETKRPSNQNVKLFGANSNRLECSTCHNVHDNTIPPFLQMSNTGSDLCLECHIK